MDKFKNSLNSILPSTSEKEIMLNNILRHKKTSFHKYALTLATACLSILVYQVVNVDQVMSVRNIQVIEYNNTCYEQIGIYNQTSANLILEDFVLGGNLYKIKNSENIVVYNENYMEFKKCEGEIYE